MRKDRSDVRPTDDMLGLFGPSAESTAASALEGASAARALGVGKRIRSARVRAGLSAAALAASIGMDPAKLSKIEHGRRRVTPVELPRFATALDVSTRYLLGAPPVDAPALSFRVASPDARASAARQRAAVILGVGERLARAGALVPATATPEGAAVLAAAALVAATPPRTRTEAQRQGRDLAGETRRLLDLGSGEIGDLAGLLEQHFAVDVALSPVGDDVSGLCAHTPGQALLLANSECTVGHVRFTLGHELAHHLLGDPREIIEESASDLYAGSYTERRASAFAAYLLLPERGVRSTLSWLQVSSQDVGDPIAANHAALGYVMARYGVSMSCALYQFAAWNLISFDRAETLKQELRAGDVLRAAAHLLPAGGDVTVATREVRVPTRLLSSSWSAARAGTIGLNTLSQLIHRADDDALFNEVFSDTDDEGGPRDKKLPS